MIANQFVPKITKGGAAPRRELYHIIPFKNCKPPGRSCVRNAVVATPPHYHSRIFNIQTSRPVPEAASKQASTRLPELLAN